ncbi:MAG TPA: AAA family ATPase [Casimicrobiaceae bacterium]|nr:AAA family ATPase [Casimicrobiaceae bacterium]
MDDLAQWLRSHGLEQYAQVFAANDVDRKLLAELTEGDLEKLGLSLGHRRKLLQALKVHDAGAGTAPPAVAAAAPSPHDGERRQVTVLFCDLVGSTALAQALDPEDMGAFIRRCQSVASDCIARYDGFVAKFMGDGVLAYFGYPHASEDAAEQAVRAALMLRDGIGTLRTPRGDVARSRIGIATGMVVVGDVAGAGASREHSIVGDTPNLAARLQALADPDTILIGAQTAQLLGRRFDLADLGEQALKGFAQPMRAWRVLGETSAESRFAATRTAATGALFGRDEELAFLLERWRRACAREGQAVLVTGEPGMGKSRLVDALLRRIPETERNRITLQCSPYHVNSALYPVIGHLQRAAGFAGGDSADARLDKLEAMLGRSQGATGLAATGLIAELLSLPADRYPQVDLLPFQRKAAMLAALVDILKRLAENAPVVLLLEDAHWIDPTTRDLLTRLIDAVDAAPVMIVVTARPEFASPWPERAHVTTLALERLTPAQCAALVADVVAPAMLPSDVVDDIVMRADGVPLFAEELGKSVSEALQDRLTVPSTLRDSLMARLDRLGDAKDTAQVAAVIGQQFSYVLLAAVAGVPADVLAANVERLVDAGLALRQGRGMEISYSFKHALVRDVAYETLLRTRRQELHAKIAHTLVAVFPAVAESEPELLAHHFSRAGDSEAASAYSERAGDRAAPRSSVAEAVAHYTAALGEVGRMSTGDARTRRELTLLLKLGPLLANLKGPQNAEVAAVYERAHEHADALRDHVELFKATWGLWYHTLVGRRLDLARDRADALIELAAKTGNGDLVLESFHCRWSTAIFRGEVPTALALSMQGIERYDRAQHAWMGPIFGGHDPGVCAYCVAGLGFSVTGQSEKVHDCAAQAIALGEALKHPMSLGHALMNALTSLQIVGDRRAVEQHARRLLELAERYNLPPFRAHALMTGSWARIAGDDIDAGVAAMESEYPRAAAVGPLFRYYAMLLAGARLDVGRHGDALTLTRDALATVTEPGVGFVVPELHRLEAAALRGLHDDDAAATALRAACDLACRQGADLLALRAAADLAAMPAADAQRDGHRRLAQIRAGLAADVDAGERVASRESPASPSA